MHSIRRIHCEYFTVLFFYDPLHKKGRVNIKRFVAKTMMPETLPIFFVQITTNKTKSTNLKTPLNKCKSQKRKINPHSFFVQVFNSTKVLQKRRTILWPAQLQPIYPNSIQDIYNFIAVNSITATAKHFAQFFQTSRKTFQRLKQFLINTVLHCQSLLRSVELAYQTVYKKSEDSLRLLTSPSRYKKFEETENELPK